MERRSIHGNRSSIQHEGVNRVAAESLAARPGWRDDAVCARLGPEMWDEAPDEEQVETCGGCPVREQCLALAYSESFVAMVMGGEILHSTRPLTPRRFLQSMGRPFVEGQHGRSWSATEDDVVRNFPPDEVRRILKHRTTRAIADRRMKLGVAGPPDTAWTAEEDRQVLARDGSDAVIGARIGRTRWAVYKRRRRLLAAGAS